MADEDLRSDGFLSRWSRRKALVRQGVTVSEPPPPAPAPEPVARPAAGPAAGSIPGTIPGNTAAAPTAAPSAGPGASGSGLTPAVSGGEPAAERPPAPTLEEAQSMSPQADSFARFVARDVDPQVKNAALKRLFADPHFNVMDGLDTYIDDYSIPDPLPAGMLAKMVQSVALGLVDPPKAAPAAGAAAQAAPDAAVEAASAPDVADATGGSEASPAESAEGEGTAFATSQAHEDGSTAALTDSADAARADATASPALPDTDPDAAAPAAVPPLPGAPAATDRTPS